MRHSLYQRITYSLKRNITNDCSSCNYYNGKIGKCNLFNIEAKEALKNDLLCGTSLNRHTLFNSAEIDNINKEYNNSLTKHFILLYATIPNFYTFTLTNDCLYFTFSIAVFGYSFLKIIYVNYKKETYNDNVERFMSIEAKKYFGSS